MIALDKALFIARKDLAYTLRDRTTLMWLLLMPPLFFYFIGVATGGASVAPSREKIAVQRPADAGFLVDQLLLRLDEAGFNVVLYDSADPGTPLSGGPADLGWDAYCRQLSVPAGLTAAIQRGEAQTLRYSSCRDELAGQFDEVRVQRALYTTLADVIASEQLEPGFSAAGLAALNALPRSLGLDVRSAGERREPPRGFQQAVPGMVVMFTLLLLLTGGAVDLLIERRRGLLRRLASAPFRREDIVFGKWLGKMALALCQIGIGMVVGSLLFDIAWAPDLPMILLLLAVWAGLCTSLALLLGSLARSERQVIGFGVLSSLLLAGLGGCWWPIEIAPAWMQALAGWLPTGWTMTALHSLMSFGAGPASVLPQLAALVVAALLLGVGAVRVFRYE